MAISITLHPYALTSLDMMKDHLGIPDLTTTQDERLKRHINAATDMLENLTDRVLKARTADQVDYQSGRSNNRILLGQWPVNSVTELWVDGSSDFTDVSKIIDPGNYRIETDSRGNGIGIAMTKGCKFPKGVENIKIVYSGGYLVVPSDLEEACIFLTDFLDDLRSDRRVGLTQKGKNQENVTFLETLPMWMQNIIDKYSRSEWPLGYTPVENG